MPKVQVRLTEKERDRLRELAAERKLTMSDLIRERIFEGRVSVAEVSGPPDPSIPSAKAIREAESVEVAVGSVVPSQGFRCPLPACRHQQKRAGSCPRHGHELVPVRL